MATLTYSTAMLVDPIAKWTFTAILLCWFAFAGVFMFRKRPAASRESKRDRLSILGIVLQSVAYFLVWSWPFHRAFFSPISPMPKTAEIGFSIVTVLIAVGSVWLVMAAVSTLGKQWAVAARLIEGHKLVTEGPYRWVRNPIYTGMFGMLVATGLAISRWSVLAIACVIFIVGSFIRIRSEERLLREAFGTEFVRYAERVPAFLPGIY